VQVAIDVLRQLVKDGYLTARPHPTADLLIWNYTPKTQFERYWTPETLMCRGLITKADGTVVARSFPKFFNYEEYTGQLPQEPFTVTEKLDGCFLESTTLNLWNGGTITIGEVVRKKLYPTLIGVDENGKIVPCQVLEHFDNGKKDNWLAITLSNPVSRKSGAANHPTVMRVTTNHHIHLNGQFQPAMMARPNDKVVTFTTEPSESVLHMIEASLLGDGCLSPTHNGYRYQEPHKQAHHEYVVELQRMLGSCACSTQITTSGYGSTMEWAGSKQYDILEEMRAKWYSEGKKIIPSDLTWVDDFTVAKWYMDDGSLAHDEIQQDRALFATNCFAREDVVRLAAKLEESYGVQCTAYSSKGWTLRINAGRKREIERFWLAIAPHIVPCMRYKLPAKYRDVEYQAYPTGEETKVPVVAHVLNVVPIPIGKDRRKFFPFGRRGLDIKTSTGNYFAKGILVHNSLGILFTLDNKPQIATRGSFTSEQAVRANAILYERYGSFRFVPSYTYLFEIIYPENRIVVNYGWQENLVLLAVIETETGKELDIQAQEWPFPVTRLYDGLTDIEQVRKLEEANAEGFVVRFAGGLRLKMKLAEYVRLHRIMTHVNERVIWELLRTNQPLEPLLEKVPDEFYLWVKRTRADLLAKFARIEEQCRAIVSRVEGLPTRKEQAALIMKEQYGGIAFAMLDKKNYQDMIWKLLYPEGARPFTVDEDA